MNTSDSPWNGMVISLDDDHEKRERLLLAFILTLFVSRRCHTHHKMGKWLSMDAFVSFGRCLEKWISDHCVAVSIEESHEWGDRESNVERVTQRCSCLDSKSVWQWCDLTQWRVYQVRVKEPGTKCIRSISSKSVQSFSKFFISIMRLVSKKLRSIGCRLKRFCNYRRVTQEMGVGLSYSDVDFESSINTLNDQTSC